MNKKERVKRAIERRGPDRVPLLYFNRNLEQSDIILIDVVRHFMGAAKNRSEWGFSWERHDDTMGQTHAPLIRSWQDFKALPLPDPCDQARFDLVQPTMQKFGKRYYIASLVLTGFTVMTFLRGFAQTLQDLYINPNALGKLADAVFEFEVEIIRQLNAYGFDAVAFYDDWGDQNKLIVSPQKWRQVFKPRYQRQFDIAHQNGLDVYFHSCGMINEIVGDLIDIGVDMLNISQPNLYDIEKLGTTYGGSTCFVCPVSYQTTSIQGDRADIYAEAKRLIDHLGRFNGGFIGYVEAYESIGLSSENYQHCIDAFKNYGKYEHNR